MISKLLIANRGEIAVRIARTCRRMGITSVAVYSAADRAALHVRACDEAYEIGPPPAAQSYLRGERIIEVALHARCDAVHPGYGFLSENADFARAVLEAGLVWVGPSPEAITLMGSKIEAKRLAVRSGVPVVPGYFETDQTPAGLATEAERIGLPVLIKASAGGGGKGMRVVRDAGEFSDALEAAGREAMAAFGDATVMLEKYLERPRHIEVQVLGDLHGRLVHLGERECSIQRRHQKVAEESPSPALADQEREAITAAALTLARAAGYANAGTVEFIYQDGEFYFLEMNTRLQVEHPVTEESLGIDLVELQLRVASGEPLPEDVAPAVPLRHALEVRLYAEDPHRGFLPATGRVTRFASAYNSPHLRIDSGVAAGDSVSAHYDPMVAKIITSSETRAQAVEVMQGALAGLLVEGLTTNLGFLRWLVGHPEFQDGELSTSFIDEHYLPTSHYEPPIDVVLAAAWALSRPAAVTAASDLWSRSPWRVAGQAMPVHLLVDGEHFHAELSETGQRDSAWIVVRRRGAEVYSGDAEVSLLPNAGAATQEALCRVRRATGSSVFAVSFPGDGPLEIRHGTRSHFARLAPPLSTDRLHPGVRAGGADTLESPMPGKVLRMSVRVGDRAEEGQTIAIVEAMKMEFAVKAPHAGVVKSLRFAEGAQVSAGDVLAELEPLEEPAPEEDDG